MCRSDGILKPYCISNMELKQHFEDMPELKACWVNAKGEWIHYEHPAYPTKVTRDEILKPETTTKKTNK